MIPVGYMAMHICSRPEEWFKAPNVVDIYSECGCISEHFVEDYIQFWKHNGYWLFDSPEIIRAIAKENSMTFRERLFFTMRHLNKSSQARSGDHSHPIHRFKPTLSRH